jgi:hypothetical protein
VEDQRHDPLVELDSMLDLLLASQNREPIESGLITNTNPSLPWIASRSASGNTSASRMPPTSTHTSLPRNSSSRASRCTNSASLRE